MRPLFALFLRSLREDVRHRGTYVLRSVLVGLILFFLWTTHQSTRWVGAPGRQFFASVLWIDLFILSVVGLSYFASAIAEEKDEGTLGLLRMTDLNPLAILLGKSTGRLLGALGLIAVQLPFLLVAVTMGGLDTRQVLAGFALLSGFAFFLANVALIGSVIFPRTSSATGFTAVVLVLFAFAPRWLGLQGFVFSLGPNPWEKALGACMQAWIDSVPQRRLAVITATGFDESPFGVHFLVSVVLGSAAFAVAWALFERFAEREGESASACAPAAPPLLAPAGTMPPVGRPTVHRYGRPGADALRWKDYHFIAGGHGATIVKTLIAALLFGLLVAVGGRGAGETGGELFTASAIVLALSLAMDAARIFRAERRDQTLSGLALLPMPIRRVVWEKMRGCFATNWPLVALLALALVPLAPPLFREIFSASGRTGAQGLFVGGGIAVNVAVWAALLPICVAWVSLRVRRGGFPIGFTVWILASYAGALVCFFTMREAAFVVLPVLGVVTGGVLAKDILGRLERLASGE